MDVVSKIVKKCTKSEEKVGVWEAVWAWEMVAGRYGEIAKLVVGVKIFETKVR